MNAKELEFIKALPEAKKQGFDIFIIYAQAAHETANFTRLVGSYNYFGLIKPEILKPPKAGWNGKVVSVATHEYVNGKKRPYTRYFCDFDNALDCLTFYLFQIQRLYKQAYADRADAIKYVDGLFSGPNRYATDPAYKRKLLELYAHILCNDKPYEILNILKGIV